MGVNLQYSGKIPVQGGFYGDLAVELRVEDGYAVLVTEHDVLGTWPIGDVSITRLADAKFLLQLGDDETVFFADDVLGMSYQGMDDINAEALRARGFRSGRVLPKPSGSSRVPPPDDGFPRARGQAAGRGAGITHQDLVPEELERLREILGSAYGTGRTVPETSARSALLTGVEARPGGGALIVRARAASIRQTGARWSALPLPGDVRRNHTVLILACALAVVVFLPRLGPDVLGPLGLVSVLPMIVWMAFASLACGFAVAAVRHPSRRLLATYVGVTAVLLHGMGPLAYEYPRYSWAWKHAGIVDYILRHGSVDPNLELLGAYHNWPGFFGLSALVTETAGLSSPLSFAAWAPILFNLSYLAALYLLYRAFTADERLIWTALMLFTIGNWLGQDYFAPQASAYLFYLLVLGILLNWFPNRRIAVRGRPGDHFVMSTTLFILIAAIVVSHQLTPVMVVIAALVLLVGRRTSLRWPPFVAAGLMLLWLGSFASPFAADYAPKVWADLQNLLTRVDDGVIDLQQVDPATRVVARATRALSVALVGLGALGYFRSFRTGISWKAALFLIGSPALLVVASSYGNEVLFRALLFALPMFTLLGGALWFSREPSKGSVLTQVTLAAALIGLMPLSILAQHGNDVRSVFSAGEVQVAGLMYELAQEGSAVIQLSNDYPTKFTNYERLDELTVSRFPPSAKDRIMRDPAGTFASWGTAGGYSETYVLVTRSQASSVARLGEMPADAYDVIRSSLRGSEQFETLAFNDDGALFRLIPVSP